MVKVSINKRQNDEGKDDEKEDGGVNHTHEGFSV